jgi:hypothetical protein
VIARPSIAERLAGTAVAWLVCFGVGGILLSTGVAVGVAFVGSSFVILFAENEVVAHRTHRQRDRELELDARQ